MDSAIDDSGVGPVGGVVVGAVVITVLVGFSTGLAVIVRSAIHLFS